MICPNCATENDAGAKFCNECGTPLAAGCPNCGATNKPGAKFCNECGTPLQATGVQRPATAASPQRDSAPVAERRLVTVLFADLVGFTPFAEDRDAEEVRETLSRYFEMCSEIVSRYGGTIEKFIGDAVMAVWGAPTAHEDDAERAVRAALGLVESVPGVAPSAQARAGVLTGHAAVTIGATNQGIVAGDLVNTASRLQAVAQPGTVLVGEATFRAAGQAIHFEPAGDQALKGKESPVPAWQAMRVIAELGGRNRRTEGLEAPFVGRTDELRLLKDLFHATGREKKVRLVSVMGVGGIGKSRLAWEFLKYVDGLVETTYWHSGRSPAYGEGVTFWALGEMVRSRCGLIETDDEHTTKNKVAETVRTWVPDDDQRAWIEKSLLALLGIDADVPSDQLFAAWRTFFERISESGTVTLVFEDTHHADSGILDFIDHLLDWSRGYPICIVTLARPELLEKRPDWGAAKRNFSSIFLEPLSAAEMRDLLAGLAPGLPEAAVAKIVDRADGIPLYAVETVRMLVADARLKEEGGVYVPVGDLTSLAVPETLQALISSRLDSLAPDDRALIHDAAVLGQSFTLDALVAVSGRAKADIEQALDGLVRRELLTRETDSRSSEKGQYLFVQSLAREVSYNTLSRKDRKSRHLAAARYFEQIGSDELASALAGHYLAAQQNAVEGAEADALAAQARLALRAAAERAATLGALDQAVSFLEEAASVTSDPSEQAQLLERAGEAATIAARADQAERLARRAVELYEHAGDRKGAAAATAKLGWALLNAHHNAMAVELLDKALAAYGDLWPDTSVIAIKISLARGLNQLDDHLRALELTDEALQAAERADALPMIARAMIAKGVSLGGLGRLHEGTALIRAGGDLARANGLEEEFLASLLVGGFFMGEIDNSVALANYREGLAYARQTGRRTILLQFVNNLGYTAFLVGEWDAGLADLEAALAEDLDAGNRVWLLSNALIIRACRGEPIAKELAELKRLVTAHGDPEPATAVADTEANEAFAMGRLHEAAEHWRRSVVGNTSYVPLAHYQAARAALWSGNLGQVVSDLAAIDESGIHGRVVEARRTTLRAGIAAFEGRENESIALYREAIRSWRDLGMVWDEALTGIDAAEVLEPSVPKVGEIVASTRGILERLGAKPFLSRLDAALERQRGLSGSTVVANPVANESVAVESR